MNRPQPQLLLLAIMMLTGFLAAPPFASAAELPPGFVEELIVENLLGPTAMHWAPDRHLWIAGKRGDVWVLRLEDLRNPEVTHVARLPVSFDGERGISGIGVDPDFSDNRHIWLYYNTPDPPVRNRLSRFRNVGDQLVDETIIFETEDLQDNVHNGGCIRFAADKTLFVSTGDDHQGSVTAQKTRDIRGKILHINRDGSPAAGNPFLEGVGGDPRVWAYGLRNPWRFNLQPETENLFITDVGGSGFEEINLGFPGANFGWRLTEGPEPPGVAGVTYPIYYYEHFNPDGNGIIGGDHARAGNFPSDFQGNYFFGDVVTREIYRMVLGSDNLPVSTVIFASETRNGPVDIQFGPDGALYFITFERGSLFRISYVGGSNRQPAAVATATPDNGRAPLEVTLDGSDSSDPEGESLSYLWDLGDGQRSEQTTVRKSYAAGEYLASLTVTDRGGLSNTVRNIRVVSGNSRPEAIVREPSPDRLYKEGEIITFKGTGVDSEEGLVPCKQIAWRVIFHHKGHTHPFLGPLEGTCEGSFVIDSHGEEQTFFEIRLTVSDTGAPLENGGALTGTQSIEIYPRE